MTKAKHLSKWTRSGVLVALLLLLCLQFTACLNPEKTKLTRFTTGFVKGCQQRGLVLPSSAEFISGVCITDRDVEYKVSFRVLADEEYLLFPETHPLTHPISSDEELPDDGVAYTRATYVSGSPDFVLYRSDVMEDGYVYCYTEFWN